MRRGGGEGQGAAHLVHGLLADRLAHRSDGLQDLICAVELVHPSTNLQHDGAGFCDLRLSIEFQFESPHSTLASVS